MKSHHDRIVGLILVFLVAASASGLGVAYSKARRLNQSLSRLRDEANQWRDSAQSIAAGNDESITTALLTARQALARQRRRWQNPMAGTSQEAAPESEVDLLLACARFEEKAAREARAAGVELAKEEELGFRALGFAAKEGALDSDVRVRLHLAEEILAALWSVRPRRLEGMRWARGELGGAGSPGTFVWKPSADASATNPEGVDSLVCRLDFQGSSECLGRLLDAVSKSSLLLVVRRVNAETIAANTTVFRVVVEWVRPSEQNVTRRQQP